VLLAAFADCDDITQGANGYPQARGNAAQLTFREHPQRGIRAVYDQFAQEPIYLYHSALKLQSAQEVT